MTPLEVWDHPARGTNLWEGRDRPDWPELVRGVALEVARRERARSIVVTGGGAARLARVLPDAAIVADPFFAALGGRALAAPALARDGRAPGELLVVDVGQTSLKVVHRARRVRIERPSETSPLAPLFARALALAPAAPLLVAVPCTLDDACAAGPCTYPDVPEVLASLDARAAATLVLNDAELAAFAAREASLVPRGASALVLTVGFGVGAAVVRDG